MTNQEILEKAIQKAIDGGWDEILNTEIFRIDKTTLDVVIQCQSPTGNIIEGTYNYERFIFNHDFAKALWGEARPTRYDVFPDATGKYGIDRKQGWHLHLMFMVIAEDPIAYLGENL